MKLECIMLFFSFILIGSLPITAMEAERRLVRSYSEENMSSPSLFVCPDLTILRTIVENQKIVQQRTTATLPLNECINLMDEASPSAPPLSELPSYEESTASTSKESAIIQASALAHTERETQTESPTEDFYSYIFPRASSTTTAELTADEHDLDYKNLLNEAQKKKLGEYFFALLKACYNGHSKIATELFSSNECPTVGKLPLLTALRGGSLETVKALLPFYTFCKPYADLKPSAIFNSPPQLGSEHIRVEAQPFLLEALQNNRDDMFIALSEYWKIQYDLPFLEKALSAGVSNKSILDYMTSHGLAINYTLYCSYPKSLEKAHATIEKHSPLYKAIKLNNPDAVAYFLEKISHPFWVDSDFNPDGGCYCFDFFLNAAQTETIKDLLIQRKNNDKEKIEREIEDRKESNNKKEQELLEKQRKEYGELTPKKLTLKKHLFWQKKV